MRNCRCCRGMPALFPRRAALLSRPDRRRYRETNPQENGPSKNVEGRLEPVGAGNAHIAQEGFERMTQIRQAVSHEPPPWGRASGLAPGPAGASPAAYRVEFLPPGAATAL